jgi:hypothetical protein
VERFQVRNVAWGDFIPKSYAILKILALQVTLAQNIMHIGYKLKVVLGLGGVGFAQTVLRGRNQILIF